MNRNRMKLATLALLVVSPLAYAADTTSPAAQECRTQYDAKTYTEAMRVCKQAAQAGDLHAQYLVGRMHEKGQGVERNFTTARTWYEKAANAGHPESQYRMAAAYYQGLGGVSKNETKALELLKRSAEGG